MNRSRANAGRPALGSVLGLVVAGLAGSLVPMDYAIAQESDVWGDWAGLPWDKSPVSAGSYEVSLNQALDLRRRGTPGQTVRYRIRRTNISLDRDGRVLNRMITDGQYIRTLIREVGPGMWAEELEWESFSLGQSFGEEAHPDPKEVAGATGIAYPVEPGAFDFVNIPGDFDRLGSGIEPYLMKVLAIDATSWDALLIGLRDRLGDEVEIGATFHDQPWDEAVTITTGDSAGQAGTYALGEMRLAVAGVTRCGGEPCALIWFSVEDNAVNQDIATDQVSVRTSGTEFFRGQMAVSLTDGRVVSGLLWGPVVSRVEVGIAGGPLREQPTTTILQQVSIQEVR